jgi:hypothetical protein
VALTSQSLSNPAVSSAVTLVSRESRLPRRCTLAAESAWNPELLYGMFLHSMFLHCVSEEVKDELASQELPTDLNSLTALTIRING